MFHGERQSAADLGEIVRHQSPLVMAADRQCLGGDVWCVVGKVFAELAQASAAEMVNFAVECCSLL